MESNSLDFSPDGSTLSSVGGRNDGLFDASDLTRIQDLQGHETDVIFSPDGQMLATARWDQATVQLWEAKNGQDFDEVWYYEDDSRYVNGIAFSPDGKYLVAGFYDGKVQLFNVDTKELVDTIEFEGSGGTSPLSFSPDGETLAVKAPDINKEVHLFSIEDGSPEQVLDIHEGQIFAMDFSSDGSMLAYGGYDGVVKIWDTDDWSVQYSFEHEGSVRDLSFSPSSKKLAVGIGNGNLCLYQIQKP